MNGDLTVRKTRTASGATGVQVVRYEGSRCVVVKHIGSARDEDGLRSLLDSAERYAEAHRRQPNLFADRPDTTAQGQLDLSQARLLGVTHPFIRRVLLACASRCHLGWLPELYLDLALMRIVEPVSKLRTLELLERYFGVRYARRTVYRLLPKLLDQQEAIETAAIQTAREDLQETFGLVLYDVTTLYFEPFKEYDLQRPGYSKDNKPQQPQVVIGLITTRSGFPVMHEVFEGNTFEGHTMLKIVRRFQERVGADKPVIVADAAMLSKDNMSQLQAQGYRYIVGARLASMPAGFIGQVHASLPRTDQAMGRFRPPEADPAVSIICAFSEARYRKDRRELDKQVKRARDLLQRNEPGRRAKFIRKSRKSGAAFEFDAALQSKSEKLLGIKGYVTNIPEEDLSASEIIAFYNDLWRVEQAFRISKSDLRTRPIFHRTQEAIRAHILVCFIALMLGKYLEIKTKRSLRQIRDELWQISEAQVRDERTGRIHILKMDTPFLRGNPISDILETQNTY